MDKIASQQQVKIVQRTDWIEFVPCLEQKNEYQIYSTDETYETEGENIGTVEENDPGLLCLFCCKAFRKYETQLQVNGNVVGTSSRPYKCCAIPDVCNWCTFFDFCQQECDVFKGGNKIGSVRWPYACFLWPDRGFLSCCELDVKDANDQIIYKISAKFVQLPLLVKTFLGCQRWSCGFVKSLEKIEYDILDAKGDKVGSITNIYNDILLECCLRSDKFAVKFPSDADENKKLLLLKAAIFLDFIHYAA